MSVREQEQRQQAYYLREANEVCDRILKHRTIMRRKEMRGCTGCYIRSTPVHPSDHSPDVHDPLGVVRPDKTDKYRDYASEKVSRLFRYPSLSLSYLCRDEVAEQWGGAVRGTRYFHSISGWPQDLDELHAMATAVKVYDLTFEQAVALLDFRNAVTELKLANGLVVPVRPNAYARFLKDLALR